ncbi:2-isopropylmalate synthase/homocitrate synthase family protein [Plesiocystis pacifica SIR-1]|uniref:2-isopropylmalate synthase/homocitrate synthase family protein n=1 Tax=Plesiocystis pacifica SIR-1 TaxID=391625 RepID=A6GJ21_9BACT|nr:LeuA family protein [Plesiocystis pacifica]EDM74135.1 2-isopropylmalate synthase/homocitrate synthase family protein [Plesiocystis pacifica SIR-1]
MADLQRDESTERSASELVFDWNSRNRRWSLSPLKDKQLTFFDETLRDGIQSPSVRDPSLEEKQEILRLTASLGIQSVDLGLPGAGARAVEDVTALIEYAEREKLGIEYACAARTHEKDINAVADIADKTGKPIMVYAFLGSSPIRLFTENWSIQTLLDRTRSSAELCRKRGLEMCFVTEDTTRSTPQVLNQLFSCAVEHGVTRLCLCDTVGHATPDGVRDLVTFTRMLLEAIDMTHVGIDWHGHNDRGLGVTNNIIALENGADRIHGTALGIGERVGNASLDQTLMNLKLLGEIDYDLTNLVPWCEAVAKACEVPIHQQYPLVGADAFRTATGVHASAVIKAIKTGDVDLADRIYSGVPANWFGKQQAIEVGFMSGESNVRYWLSSRDIEVEEALVKRIFAKAKSTSHILTDAEIMAEVDAHRASN